MKLSENLGSQLPKINLKKFDDFRKHYESLHSVRNSYQQTKSLLRTIESKEKSSQRCEQQFKQQNKWHKSLSLLSNNNTELKPQYQSKSISFYKSSSRTQLMKIPIKKSKQQAQTHKFPFDKKANTRQIDSKFVLESIPRLAVSKSEAKLTMPTNNTNYQNWYPKRNKIRDIENIKHQNYLKLLKFQESFFCKCRNANSLLKLTKNQQLNH